MLPHACAWLVCHEATVMLRSEIPMRYVPWLTRRARQLYAVNAKFNRRLRGASGREWLHAFLRHWLTGRLIREHRQLARRIPSGFAIGLRAA